jgi:hypothetical protein
MNESIAPKLTNVEQSSREEKITEPNGNGISDAAAIEPKNLLGKKRKPVLIADGTGHADPPIEDIG